MVERHPTICAELAEMEGGQVKAFFCCTLKAVHPSPSPMWHHSISTGPTFWMLVLVCDIQTRVASHRLGADVFANGVSVQRILLLVAIRRIIDPSDTISIHLREDEDHVKIPVHITVSDSID